MKKILVLMLLFLLYNTLFAMDPGHESQVFYWRGYANINTDFMNEEDVNLTLAKIINGQFKAVNLEKLRGHDVYSARINKADRLLFTTAKHLGGAHIVLLDVVRNHDYDKSKFLKPNVLSSFLKKHSLKISEQIIENDFEKCDNQDDLSPLKIEEGTSGYKFSPADFHNNKFIIFNTDQENALAARLPAVVSGPPGSGKSSVALSMLLQLSEQPQQQHLNKPIIYVTKSSHLVNSMKSMWANLPHRQDIPVVQFKTYNEILTGLYDFNGNELVDENYFDTWLNNNKNNPNLKALSKYKDIFYQEFRIISGFNTCDDYKKSGKRNASIDESQREVMFSLYQLYQEHLGDNNKIDPAFFAFDLQDNYSFMVVDESQDLSRRQLLNLRNLVENRQIAFCIDTHQSLLDTKSIRPFIKSIDNDASFISLPSCYRCPSSVLELANIVIRQKMSLTGGLVDKEEYPEITLNDFQTENVGEALWISKGLQEHIQHIQENLAGTTDFAIVTNPEFIDEAQDVFNTPLVFTPGEIKGLEYKTILTYKLFDRDIFKEANKLLNKLSGGETKKVNRPKTKGNFDDHFGPAYNEIFTAFTRATERLVIYQDETHFLKHVIDPLLNIVNKDTGNITLVPNNDSQLTTEDQWRDHMNQLIDQGNLKQAQDIFITKLNPETENFDLYVQNRTKSPITKPDTSQQKNHRASKSLIVKDSPPSNQTNKNKRQQRNIRTNNNEKKERIVTHKISKKSKRNRNKKRDTNKLILDSLAKNFYGFAATEEGRLFLKAQLENNPELAGTITAQSLNNIHPQHKVSALYWLTGTEEGRPILKILLENNPELAGTITAKSLNNIQPQHKASALYWLTGTEEGRPILKIMLEHNPELAKAITEQSLNNIHPQHKVSALYWLTGAEDGRSILEILLKYNPELAGTITAQSLNNIHQVYNVSALYWLTVTEDGRSILKILLGHNPELARTITAKSLNNIQPQHKVSTLYWLTVTEDGRSILKILLGHNPELARMITTQSLNNIHPQHKVSALYWLTVTEDGRSILKILLGHNPKLAKAITEQSLNNIHPQHKVSALYWLTATEDGRSILKILLENNPKLIGTITAHIQPEYNVSALYWLTATEDGRSILKILLENNPKLAKAITEQSLNNIHQSLALHQLTRTEDGRSILKILLENNYG